jgi:hypothetical protein
VPGRASAFAFAIVLLASAPARAGDGSSGEPVRVEYAAPRECPGQPAFEAALAEHLGTATFARLGELARTLTVDIEPEPQGFRARVELVDRQGRATERSISAPTCEQAMRAIALVAALAARSQAEQAERERSAEAAKSADEATPGVPPPLPPPTPVGPAPRAPPAPVRSRPAVPPPEENRLALGVSAGLGASTGVGPGVAPGLLVAGRFGIKGSPVRSAVLSALAYDTFRRSLDVADVRFRLIKGRIELCPIEPRISARILLSPCPGFELGSQTGQSYPDGDRVETPHTVSELWIAVTLAVRLRLHLGALELGFGPELGVPLRRNRFTLTNPERPVYDVPRATVGLSAALGLAW